MKLIFEHTLLIIFCALITVSHAISAPNSEPNSAPSLISFDKNIQIIQSSSDGRRLVVLLNGATNVSAQFQIYDMSNPTSPVNSGTVEVVGPAEIFSISPDGRFLLTSVISGQRTKTTDSAFAPKTYNTQLIDISNPKLPKIIWRKAIQANALAIARDASSYAWSVDDLEQINVAWTNSRHSATYIKNENTNRTSNLELTSNGNFLFFKNLSTIVGVADLRGKSPAIYTTAGFAPARNYCVIGSSEDGYSILTDDQFNKVGVYAPQPGLPRIAILPRGSGIDCGTWQSASFEKKLYVVDSLNRLNRIDIARPTDPRITARWTIPAGFRVSGIDNSERVYAIKNLQDQHQIGIFQFGEVSGVKLDWKVLESTWKDALKIYNDKSKDEFSRGFGATQKFSESFSMAVLNADVDGVSNKVAAAILTDYAFISAKSNVLSDPDIQAILRRALELDPDRAVAHLNLADSLRKTIDKAATWDQKLEIRKEARTHYETYIALGGNRSNAINSFFDNGIDKAAGDNICRAIAAYSNVGRLDELVARATDVKVGNRLLDLLFTTEGTAHVPAVYAFDSKTDQEVSESGLDIPDAESLWGGDNLAFVRYKGVAHVLHYRDLRHPVSSRSVADDKSCTFMPSTEEIVATDALEPELCSALDTIESIKFEKDTHMTYEKVHERYSETGIDGVKRIDVANNGQPVYVGEFSVASGRGPGCGENFFDLVDAGAKDFQDGPSRDLLVKLEDFDNQNWYPLKCGNSARFIDYKGMIYFENKPQEWPPRNEFSQYHRVARARLGKVEDVCKFSFNSSVKAITK